MGKTARESVLAAIAAMVAIAAAIAFAPAAYADEAVVATPAGVTSQYALLRSDGYLVPCDSLGVELSDSWAGTYVDGKLDNVHTVFVASDVYSIAQSHTVRFAEPYGYRNITEVERKFNTLSSAYTEHEGGLPKLNEVRFLPGSRCTVIGSDAFNGASRLSTIHLPDSVKRIDYHAFWQCSTLYDVTLGSSLLSIGQGAFAECVNLTEIDLPATCSSLYVSGYQGASFEKCTNLHKVVLRSITPPSDEGDGKSVWKTLSNTPLLVENNDTFVYVPTRALTAYRNHYGIGGREGDGWSKLNQGNLDKLRGLDGEPTDIGDASVALSQTSYTYDGKAKAPSVTVTLGSSKLKQGASANDYATADYTVSYADNVDAGTATVTVAGIGLYAGTKTATFTIAKPASTGKGGDATNGGSNATAGGKSSDAKAANTIVVIPKTAKVSKSKKAKTIARSKVLAVSRAQGTVTYKKLSGNKKITINPNNGKVTVKGGLKKKTYKVKVRVTAAGNGNYKAGYRDATFKVKVK